MLRFSGHLGGCKTQSSASKSARQLQSLRQRVVYFTERAACLQGYDDNHTECSKVCLPKTVSYSVRACSPFCNLNQLNNRRTKGTSIAEPHTEDSKKSHLQDLRAHSNYFQDIVFLQLDSRHCHGIVQDTDMVLY